MILNILGQKWRKSQKVIQLPKTDGYLVVFTLELFGLQTDYCIYMLE